VPVLKTRKAAAIDKLTRCAPFAPAESYDSVVNLILCRHPTMGLCSAAINIAVAVAVWLPRQ
jgi:hypothetical protein